MLARALVVAVAAGVVRSRPTAGAGSAARPTGAVASGLAIVAAGARPTGT